MNKKDCIEYDSCMEQLKVEKAQGQHLDMTHDPETEELVIDLHCESCKAYRTTRDV